jgi:UPF0716 protein FxsA
MPLLLLLLFIGVPLLELYVIITVGEAIGIIPTILLLLADSMLGAALMRSQGRAAWRRFNLAIAEGRIPGREVLDGALVIFGGALLLTPGFVSDIFGLFFLLPPTRAIARRVVVGSFGKRVTLFMPGMQTRPRGPAPDHDFEGTAHEVDPPALP